MTRKSDGARIDDLVDLTRALSSQIEVHDTQIKGIIEGLKQGTDTTEGHTSKITIIEQQLNIIDLKGCAAAITAIEKELIAIRNDLSSLKSWKDDQKKERDETSRRAWALLPNLLAAVVGGLVSLGIALLIWWLNKPK